MRGRVRLRLYDVYVYMYARWGNGRPRTVFLLRLLDRLGGVCRRAGGRSVGWSGGAAGLGYLLASVGSVGGRLGRLSRLGSWAGAGVGAEKRRLPRESRDTSGDIRRDGRQT